ncbi:MAG: serine hydrolase [Proteobacteria bacterium]|nr:serine hydrolase [Pseudomonadota bacterium]
MNRRQVLQTGLTSLAATSAAFSIARSATGPADAYAPLTANLDRFAEQYLRARSAPGMTLVLADRQGARHVATYGLGDREAEAAVKASDLFQIGSISKSFMALCLLQLHDEGKLDLHKPITDYLPWFRVDMRFGPITSHHLLTHTSGLPGTASVFPSDPAVKHLAAHAPGAHFHYNNMAFELLGYLIWTLDGRELPQALRARILEPLGMVQTEPVITFDMRSRLVKSYAAFFADRPDASSVRMCEAPGTIETSGAGCVASTANDMGAYVQMLANGGVGPKGRLVSKESFELFCKPHVVAEEFGPTASYGYGIAVDHLDGHKVIRHTGGMLSFMSSILVDLDEGVGAFASINAMQGYRPTTVTTVAVQQMRAMRSKKPLPAPPAVESPWDAENAADYVGTYRAPAGGSMVIERDADRIYWKRGQERIALQPAGEADQFVVAHPDFSHFKLVFTRQDPDNEHSPITESAWGTDWYVSERYQGPREFPTPAEWNSYVGHYWSENPWIGSTRIVLRKGRLWLDGATPLEAQGDVFYLRDEKYSPEWIRFSDPVNGHCMRISLSGESLWRVAAI